MAPSNAQVVEWRRKPKEASNVRFGSIRGHREAFGPCPLCPQLSLPAMRRIFLSGRPVIFREDIGLGAS